MHVAKILGSEQKLFNGDLYAFANLNDAPNKLAEQTLIFAPGVEDRVPPI